MELLGEVSTCTSRISPFFLRLLEIHKLNICENYQPYGIILHWRNTYILSDLFPSMPQYYYHRFGLDFRSLRFPGVISPNMPGGGTTDYAIHIFYEVLRTGRYTCFLREDSRLPMIYIDDCLQVSDNLLQTTAVLISARG